ncbi:MAG: V-type ATP synthase subunit D [Thermoprotei archaeon]
MSIGRVAATKGVLQRLREQLKFIEKGKNVLKMKRDQLAGEINKLLPEIKRRRDVEKLFNDAYLSLKYAYAVLGYDEVESASKAVELIEVRALPTSVMGVVMPEIEIVKKPDSKQVPLATLFFTTEKLNKAIEEVIKLAILEAKIEQLSRELMDINRKVNALEKVVIPAYQSLIRYIEDRLNEEALEEFFITKHVRDIIRVRRE